LKKDKKRKREILYCVIPYPEGGCLKEIKEVKVKGDQFLEVEFKEIPTFWERRMSELINDGVVLDLKNAKKALEVSGDKIVYYVYNLWNGIKKYKKIKERYKINFDVTLLKSGIFSPTKNGETFLTYGHKHEKERGEFYTTLKNGCYLLLSDLERKRSVIVEMEEGSSVLIHPKFIHRLISIGEDCLVLGVVPEDAGHNYNIVKNKGFPHHIFIQDGKLKIVENKKYNGFSIEKVSAKKISLPTRKLFQVLMQPNKYKKLYNLQISSR
jgi:glucose-6-phosphate isomerase